MCRCVCVGSRAHYHQLQQLLQQPSLGVIGTGAQPQPSLSLGLAQQANTHASLTLAQPQLASAQAHLHQNHSQPQAPVAQVPRQVQQVILPSGLGGKHYLCHTKPVFALSLGWYYVCGRGMCGGVVVFDCGVQGRAVVPTALPLDAQCANWVHPTPCTVKQPCGTCHFDPTRAHTTDHPPNGPGAPILLVEPTEEGYGPEGCNLFIFHIPNDMTNLALYSLFGQYGRVVSSRIMVGSR